MSGAESKKIDPAASADERREFGKALRSKTPRSAMAEWEPGRARDPLEVIAGDEAGRIADLLPIRHERMAAGPFAFFRGAAAIMAADLAGSPTSGLKVQICGDAHLLNFGLFATPERNLVFDLNDFDETLPAPFEWDVKRFAASLAVLATEQGASPRRCRALVQGAVGAYRREVCRFANLSHLEIYYARIDADVTTGSLGGDAERIAGKAIGHARRRTNLQAFEKLTTVTAGRRLIADDPPLIEHVGSHGLGARFGEAFDSYLASLPLTRRQLLSRYRLVDTARKVVGVGSVGTECDIALLLGDGENDPLFLQVKQARPSVYAPSQGRSRFRNHGKRVVIGQQLMQAASDIFLGWLRLDDLDAYVRQLRDMKGAADVEKLSPKLLGDYARLCASALARAHARSGWPVVIAGYMGNSDRFEHAIADFAVRYAEQNAHDHAEFVGAIEAGRFPVSGRKRPRK